MIALAGGSHRGHNPDYRPRAKTPNTHNDAPEIHLGIQMFAMTNDALEAHSAYICDHRKEVWRQPSHSGTTPVWSIPREIFPALHLVGCHASTKADRMINRTALSWYTILPFQSLANDDTMQICISICTLLDSILFEFFH